MSKLAQNTVTAERLRGCVFSELFESQTLVEANGGVVSGTPTISFGLTTDGTDDSIAYPAVQGVKSISFWVTLATTTEDIMQLSASHSVEVVSGTITATGVTSPTYYVNGAATSTITTARSHVTITTATAFNADDITVGQDDSFGEYKLERLQMWNNTLTATEASDLADNSTYNYIDNAYMYLPLRTAQHDVPGVRTLDISGNDLHMTFGNGSTSSTYPTKLTNRGYSFDTGDSFRRSMVVSSAPATITVIVDSRTTNVAGEYFWDARAGAPAGTGWAYMNTSRILSGDSGTFYINGLQASTIGHGINVLTVANQTLSITSALAIGARFNFNGALNFTGKMLAFIIHDYVLTPLQIHDLYVQLMREVNWV